jgi:hypothetical protein
MKCLPYLCSMKSKENYFEEFQRVADETGETKLNRIWEIFCYQNDIDEDDEEIGEIFDEWSE